MLYWNLSQALRPKMFTNRSEDQTMPFLGYIWADQLCEEGIKEPYNDFYG